jgi:hypothetical protein
MGRVQRIIEQRWFQWVTAVVLGLFDGITAGLYRMLRIQTGYGWMANWQSDKVCLRFPPTSIPSKTWTGQPLPFSATDCKAQYLAGMIFAYVDAEAVDRAIGRRLKRADVPGVPAGKHPVVYLFGLNQNLRRDWVPFHGIDYLEAGVGVPNILAVDGTVPHFYIVKLWLNRLYPTVLGWMVGYPKVLRQFRTTQTTYEIRSWILGRPQLRATFRQSGAITGPEALPNAAQWLNYLAQPQLNLPIYGGHVDMEYDLRWAHAMIQPASVEVEALAEGLPLLPPGKYVWPGIDEAVQGVMIARVPFELTCPLPEDVFRGPQPPRPSAGADAHGTSRSATSDR